MRQIILSVALIILTFVSAVGLVKTRHSIRHALNDLHELNEEILELQIENNKLLLEYTHLASSYRIEDLAKSKLNMQIPKDIDIINIR